MLPLGCLLLLCAAAAPPPPPPPPRPHPQEVVGPQNQLTLRISRELTAIEEDVELQQEQEEAEAQAAAAAAAAAADVSEVDEMLRRH